MRAGLGQVIGGHYRLVEPIGRGGFAEVWRARDERLHRDVAAKRLFLPPHFTAEQRAEQHARTLREARAAARLAHPGVVTVHEVVADRGDLWLVMELVQGRSLAALVRAEGPLPPRRAAVIGLRLLDALRAAHDARVLHRDVKPANVLIGEERVVLGDFGLAVVEGDPGLTCSGIVMGAAAYTAPERARGEPAVPASDLWSLGATLFYAVEGRRPFEAANANAMLHAILTREPAPAPHAGPLAPVIEGLLRKDPGARLTAGRAAALLARAVNAPDGPGGRAGTGVSPGGGGRVRGAAVLALAAVGVAAATMPAVLDRAGRSPARPASVPAATPRLVAALPGGPERIFTLAVSPDGRTLAAGEADRTVRLWDIAGHRPSAMLAGSPGDVLAAAFSPHGRMLATGGRDGRVILWSTRRWRRIATLDAHGERVDALSFSPDGTLLAGAGDSARLWSVPRRRPAGGLPADGQSTSAVAFAPRGHVLATAGAWTLRLWNARRPARPAAVTPLASPVAGMAFSADGRTLATGGYDGHVRLWDVASHRLVATLPALPGRAGVAFSPDGRRLACAGGDSVLVWDVPGGAPESMLRTPAGLVDAVAFTPAGMLATADDDATVRLWRLDPPPTG